jgi:hypothetical protein
VADLEAIGEAIGGQLETLDGVRVQQEFGTAPNVSGTALVAVVEYDGSTYDATFGGVADANYKIVVLGGQGSERATRKRLLALCDPTPGSATSIASLLGGTSLGGVVASCRLVSNTGLQDFNLAGGEAAPTYPGVEFVVAVMP